MAFVRAHCPRLVLGLGTPHGRLMRHHPLPFGSQHAFLAVTIAKFAIALVALQYDLFAVVAATGTVRRRPRRPGATARTGCGASAAAAAAATQIGLVFGRLGVVPALVGHHAVTALRRRDAVKLLLMVLMVMVLVGQIEEGFNGETVGGGGAIETTQLQCVRGLETIEIVSKT